jgi:hypothetical protein
MQIRDLSQPITSKRLNENMAKTIGVKLNLDQFTDQQLHDAQNKLRTEMSQFEVSESFDSVSGSPQYQKTRMLHDVITAEILERDSETIAEGAKVDRMVNHIEKSEEKAGKSKKDAKNIAWATANKRGMLDNKNHKKAEESMEHGNDIYLAKLAVKAKEHAVPTNWIASAIKRIELNESTQQELASELVTRYDLTESVANHIVYLEEGEEDKAKIIMSTKDMVDRVTGWLDDVSEMRAEQLLQLIDSIRAEQGAQVAEQFTQAVRPALDEIYSSLEKTRGHLHSALSVVSGVDQGEMMGAPAGGAMPGAEPGADMGMPGADLGAEPGTEPGADETAPPMGREQRESIEYSRKLGQLLASKKK